MFSSNNDGISVWAALVSLTVALLCLDGSMLLALLVKSLKSSVNSDSLLPVALLYSYDI